MELVGAVADAHWMLGWLIGLCTGRDHSSLWRECVARGRRSRRAGALRVTGRAAAARRQRKRAALSPVAEKQKKFLKRVKFRHGEANVLALEILLCVSYA